VRHAGCGWPNGPVSGGNRHILSLPAPDLLMLGSEHWHVVEAQNAGKRVLFRGMARPGYRPAELNWDASDYVREITRDMDRLPPGTVRQFVAWNELNLQDERGDHEPDHGDLTELMTRIGRFTRDVVILLRRKYPGVELHYGAFAPKDETDYVDLWRAAAESCDVIDVHAYGHGIGIVGHVSKYQQLFPNHPINLTEWHSDFEGPEMDRDTLALLANFSTVQPDFRAYYFMWNWHNPPSHQADLARAIAIEGNGSRMALFLNPPQAEPVPEPIPEPEPVPMPVDPWQHFTAEALAAATECPLANVQANWPKLVEQLAHCGINEQLVQIGLAGTIAIESASTMAPVREAYYLGEPEPAESHRKTLNYYPYYGRGFIQLTHRGNYLAYGPRVAELWGTDPAQPDFDLVGQPDRALDPDISAAVSALFFRDTETVQGYSLVDACRTSDWDWVRRLVLGGVDPAGTARIARIANELTGAAPAPTPGTVTYNASTPAIAQDDDWSCAPTALRWALTSLGRNPGPKYIEELLVRDGVVSKEQGLLDASGAGLAAWIGKSGPAYYGDDGFYGNNEPSVTFDGVALEGDHAYPLLIGGRAWNHWSGVRGYDAGRGLLLLANPSDGWMGVGQTMDAAQFRSLGPFSMVRVLHPDLLTMVPDPPVEPPVPPTEDTRIPRARQKLVEAIAILDEGAP
jgi:hypothetical protein